MAESAESLTHIFLLPLCFLQMQPFLFHSNTHEKNLIHGLIRHLDAAGMYKEGYVFRFQVSLGGCNLCSKVSSFRICLSSFDNFAKCF